MTFDYIMDMIIQKWGRLEHESNYLYSGSPSYLSGGKFNYVFRPINMDPILKYFSENNLSMPDELKSFYTKCNGLKIALGAFSIYGFPDWRNRVKPFDFLLENMNIHTELKVNGIDSGELLFFGSFIGTYAFAYSNNYPNHYFCYNRCNLKTLLSFASFLELCEFFVPKILLEYDKQFNKLKPNIEYADIPLLANSLLGLDGLD